MREITPLSTGLNFFSSADRFENVKMLQITNIMNFLIIDAASDTVYFFLYYNNKSYSKSFLASKTNFEKITNILFKFLKGNNIHLKKINNILVNQGPGRFSSLRISIAITKAISVSNNIDFYGFNGNDLKDNNYLNIIKLFKEGNYKKNLIKTIY